MAELARKNLKIFGLDSVSADLVEYGSRQDDGSFTTASDVEVMQSRDNFLEGLRGSVITSGTKKIPTLQDLNTAMYVIYRQLAYLFEKGVAEWDDGTTYYINSIVRSGSILYRSLTDTNLNNAVTVAANWVVYYNPNILTATSTTPYTITTEDTLYVDASGGDKIVNLPTPVGINGRKIKIIKSVDSANKITITPAAGNINGFSNVYLYAQYNFIEMTSDGSNWIITNSYTKKIFDMGDWDMDADTVKNVVHGISDLDKILDISTTLRNDTGTEYTTIQKSGDTNASLRQVNVNATNIQYDRLVAGFYDSTNYDSTSYNRAIITIDLKFS